jgi:hypothetical protein
MPREGLLWKKLLASMQFAYLSTIRIGISIDLFDEYTNLVCIIDKVFTMKGTKLNFLTIFLLVIGIMSCSKPPASSIESVDKPSLSSQEAISIAKREAITDHTWTRSEALANTYASRSEGWTAEYKGYGVWGIELRALDYIGGWQYKYLWRVIERNRTAKYIAKHLYPIFR